MIDENIDLTPYVKKHLQESKTEEIETDKLFKKLNKEVREIAKRLGVRYNLKKIYLFGSLTERENFHLKSDIDLGVKGIDSAEYLDLWGDFERELEHSFDLVNMNRCGDRLKSYIEKEGEIIYDCQKKKSQ